MQVMCGMRVLVIGREPSLFDENSEAFKRIREYAGLFDELHIVSGEEKKQEPKRYGNLYIWPAYSSFAVVRMFSVLRLGIAKARKHHIRIIDAQDVGEWGLLAWLVSVRTGIPFRAQIHTDIFSPRYRKASWKERFRYGIAEFLIPRADCIRVVSERIKKSIETRNKKPEARITVLPIFTDVSEFLRVSPNQNAQRFNMVAAGRFIDREKNFSMLIRMMADLVKACPNVHLTIFGDGPDRNYYHKIISSNDLGKYVKIKPWTDRAGIINFFSSCDAYLLSSNYEGWGRVVIEAMASGLPVIMTDVGLAGEVVKNGVNGIVVPVDDLNAMSDAVQDIYNNKEKLVRMAKAGRETARITALMSKENYLSLYKQSLENCL